MQNNPPTPPPRASTSRQRKQQLLARLQFYIETERYPRLFMIMAVVSAALFAFVASYGLRVAGVHDMAIRYLIVWLLVYVLFILMVRAWLYFQDSDDHITNAMDVTDLLPDGTNTSSISSGAGSGGGSYSGGNGNFGGGGAKGEWTTQTPATNSQSIATNQSDGLLEGIDVDVGDAVIPLLAIVAIGALVFGLVGGLAWTTYSLVEVAPILLAELLADILIVNGLGRRMRLAPVAGQYWLLTIWQRTQKFFWTIIGMIVILFLLLHGFGIEAQTLGELVKMGKS